MAKDRRRRGVKSMAEKITLATLDAMTTEDLKTIRKAVGLVLSLRGDVTKRKAK